MEKILIIITTEFVSYGGLTTVMMNYYRNLDRNQFQVDFASTNYKLEKKIRNELDERGSKYYFLGNRKKNPFLYMRKLRDVIKDNNYDAVHVNSNSATATIELLIAKKCKVKKRIVHNHTSKCNHLFLHKMMYPLFKRLYTDAIACSSKAGEWIYKDGKYEILKNGIEVERFRYNECNRNIIRKKYNIDDECLLLGHVGKIYEPKNHMFLVKVFSEYHKKNSNSKLLLVGDGGLRKQVENLVSLLDVKESVIFAGMQSEVNKYLSAFDIFLFPSIWEGMPLSLIEAQASGLPCIVSDAIDVNVKVTESLIMLPINNIDAWVEEINNTIIPQRISHSSRNIRDIQYAGYDTMQGVKQLERIYKSKWKGENNYDS